MQHDRKTLEFEADSDSNNVTLNNREHFALKNLGSGVQATISAIGNRKKNMHDGMLQSQSQMR